VLELKIGCSARRPAPSPEALHRMRPRLRDDVVSALMNLRVIIALPRESR